MTEQEFQMLDRGCLVRHKSGGPVYVVTANYGDRLTAVASVELTNPMEWDWIKTEVVRKS